MQIYVKNLIIINYFYYICYMKTFTYTFEISDEAYSLLLSIQKEGYAEYRDHHYDTLEKYLEDHTDFVTRNNNIEEKTQRFLSRNHGGTYHLVGELLKYNLIEDVEDSWHITYKLSDFAKELLSLQNIRNEKLIEILK